MFEVGSFFLGVLIGITVSALAGAAWVYTSMSEDIKNGQETDG